ncbi:hypothetical protein O181_041321 [Austropuccinia psidii MF-1]|uniref:Uncharacterized protein n=1 Tax=Austropuccinia psidii MF-1 TaxID=1389203 RepID=A0A9Q3DJH3_9BASI|nr:hypothetical protein [Austropuccinia psidii MF-1]
MPFQHIPPAKNTRSQRNPAVLTPTARDHQWKRQHPAEEGEESVEEKESEETEVATALEGAPEASEATNIAHSKQPLVSQAEPNFLKTMEQITQFMGQLTQAVAPRDNSKAPAFKTLSMKAPDSFDGTHAHK